VLSKGQEKESEMTAVPSLEQRVTVAPCFAIRKTKEKWTEREGHCQNCPLISVWLIRQPHGGLRQELDSVVLCKENEKQVFYIS
jgi:hypothetical protein